MPSCQSLRKFDSTPIEKKVRMKKITRNVLASPIAAGTFSAMSAGVAEREVEPDREGDHEADDELREALPDFRWPSPCPVGATLMWLVQM